MNLFSLTRAGAVAVLMALSILLSGCKTVPKPTAKTITVQLDPAWPAGPVRVDLVAVNSTELNQYKTCSMTAYWGPGDTLRVNARKKSFTLQTPGAQEVLPVSSPEWTGWLAFGVTNVLVLADLPNKGKDDDAGGDEDPRRGIVPLADKTSAFMVIVRPNKVEVLPQLPK